MKPRVLFIEDDRDQVNLYKTKFELEGFDFLYAYNGTEGMVIAKEKKPGLIFLDILMPDENGLEVLKKLKKDKDTKEIPTVLFTNLSNKTSREEGMKLGAVDYLIKTDITLKDLIRWTRENIKSA
jgi:Response regulator containing CheY-like receiver, AAA-type ATPase, and DNA-binding domains